jgi:hypothetical protein
MLGEDPLVRSGTLEGSSLSKMRVSEVDPLLKKRAPIELIVNTTIRSATPEGIDLTFTPKKRFTEFKVECVSKLLMLAVCCSTRRLPRRLGTLFYEYRP